MSQPPDLPPALASMWRALKRGYRAEPLLLSISFALALLAALPDALIALWLKLLADGALDARTPRRRHDGRKREDHEEPERGMDRREERERRAEP